MGTFSHHSLSKKKTLKITIETNIAKKNLRVVRSQLFLARMPSNTS